MAKYEDNFADQVYKVRRPYHPPSHLDKNTTKFKNTPAPPVYQWRFGIASALER